MLYITIATLLIASNGISRIQCEEQGDRRAQPSGVQTSLNGGDSVIEALLLQKNRTFNTSPKDTSKDGPITMVETDIYDSPYSRQLSNTQFPTFGATGSPGYRGVIYGRSEEQDHRRQPDQNQIPGKRTGINLGSVTYQVGNTFIVKPGSRQVFGAVTDQRNRVFRFVGGQNQTQLNGGDVNYGSTVIQINNTFITDKGVKDSSGSHLYHGGDVSPDMNVTSEEKKQQNIKSQAQLRNSSNRQWCPSYKKFYSLFILFNCIVQLFSVEK